MQGIWIEFFIFLLLPLVGHICQIFDEKKNKEKQNLNAMIQFHLKHLLKGLHIFGQIFDSCDFIFKEAFLSVFTFFI